MSFSSEPFSGIDLVKASTPELSEPLFYWECSSCGADSQRKGLVTNDLIALWNSWVNHLINSHKLTRPDK